MTAKIIIRRSFKEGNTAQILALFKEMHATAKQQPGYVSAETWMKKGDLNHMVVVSAWESLEAWKKWRNSAERNKYEAMLELYQETPTEYEEYIKGSVLLLEERP